MEPFLQELESLYTPLQDARTILAERRSQRESDLDTIDTVEWIAQELPNHSDGYAFLCRWIATPNFETLRFLELARGSKLLPVIEEYYGDKFHDKNPLKKALTCLRFVSSAFEVSSVMQITEATIHNISIGQITTIEGGSLVNFHRSLFNKALESAEMPFVYECTPQYKRISGCVHKYYRSLFKMCIKRGILFEDFLPDHGEGEFTRRVVFPAFRNVCYETGLKPLVVRLCPRDNADAPLWYSYNENMYQLAKETLKERALSLELGLNSVFCSR